MVKIADILPLKIGLLSITLAWFSFDFYTFAFGIINRTTRWPIIIQDIPGVLGTGFRTGASFIALITVLLWIFSRDFSKKEITMAVRFMILFEAGSFLSLISSGVYGFIFPELLTPTRIIGSTLPVLTESLLIPIVLIKLFFALSPTKPVRNKIKWAMIAGVCYLLIFWLNYMGNWVYTVLTKGVDYILAYPVNLFSFGLASIGLLALIVYTIYFAKKTIGLEDFRDLDLEKVGLIITLLGMYFVTNYFLWCIFGFVGGWSSWYAWFINHNVDLWLLTAPILGLSLMITQNIKEVKVPISN